MLLPTEALLDVLLFADFSTLVSAKFVAASFLVVVTAHDHLLAIQRHFHILLTDSFIAYGDMTNGARWKSIRFNRADQQSFADACRALADVVGQHAVVKLVFSENTWKTLGFDVLFTFIPALKFARNVIANMRSQAGGNSEDFMLNFAMPEMVSLSLDFDVFRHFKWSFIGLAAARELRTITVSLSYKPYDNGVDYEDVLESNRRVLEGFIHEVIQILEEPGRETVVKLCYADDDDVRLDLGRFNAVEINADTVLYSSPTSGVTVEVNTDALCITVSGQPSDGVSRREDRRE